MLWFLSNLGLHNYTDFRPVFSKICDKIGNFIPFLGYHKITKLFHKKPPYLVEVL